MSCSHAHDCEAASCGEASLHSFVNHPCVTALNALDPAAAARVLRPWHERRLVDAALESMEDDPELLLHIPFTADVRLRGILVTGGSEGRAPTEMRAFINRNDVDFGLAEELTPVQEWALVEGAASGDVEYACKPSKFNSLSSLTLHFPRNGGAATTRITFVGLRGEGSKASREPPRHIVYEAQAQPKDHRVSETARARMGL